MGNSLFAGHGAICHSERESREADQRAHSRVRRRRKQTLPIRLTVEPWLTCLLPRNLPSSLWNSPARRHRVTQASVRQMSSQNLLLSQCMPLLLQCMTVEYLATNDHNGVCDELLGRAEITTSSYVLFAYTENRL